MELTRLMELTSVRNTKVEEQVQIQEATKSEADFDGIRSIVDDALGDLGDKLGKGGSLATLFKASGASKLDTYKDESGKNVLAQIISLTTEYKKAISKLMTEAELLVNQSLSEGIELDDIEAQMLAEAKGYGDDGTASADFNEEFNKLQTQVISIKNVMKAPRWMSYLQTTDDNFGTDTVTPGQAAISALNTLNTQLNEIESEMDRAQ